MKKTPNNQLDCLNVCGEQLPDLSSLNSSKTNAAYHAPIEGPSEDAVVLGKACDRMAQSGWKSMTFETIQSI